MLHKKVSFIAGASDGIGRMVARSYAKEGSHVILADKDLPKLEETYDLIIDNGGSATITAVDFNDSAKVAELAKHISSSFKYIDVMVGLDIMIGEMLPLVDYSLDTWNAVISSNLSANWYLLRCFDPLLKISKNPRAIFITSEIVNGSENFFYAPYAASKAALENLATSYANENKQSGLKVNLVELALSSDRPEHNLASETSYEVYTRMFLQLASDNCRFTGKKHLIQC